MARPSLYSHRKFRALSRALKSRALAVGTLELLWHAGYSDGDPLLGSSQDVEEIADWKGKRGALTSTLVECGFIDDTAGGYAIHNLYKHAPEYVKKRDHRAIRKTLTCPDSDRTATGHRTYNVRPPSVPTVPTVPAVPTHTIPAHSIPTASMAGAIERAPGTSFEEFWNAYPKKYGWGAAARAWVEHAGDSAPLVMAALAWQVRSERWIEDGGRWIPKPEKYLVDRMWLDSPDEVKTVRATLEAEAERAPKELTPEEYDAIRKYA